MSESFPKRPTIGMLLAYEHHPEEMPPAERDAVERYIETSPTMRQCREDRAAWEEQVLQAREKFFATRRL